MHILVLDDDPMQTAALRRVLEPEGHNVYQAHTVEEAVALSGQNRIQLAIIDWELGGGQTGSRIGRILRKQGIATFMISGHSKEKIRAQWVDPLEGFLKFYDKPVDYEELHNDVQRLAKSFEDTEP